MHARRRRQIARALKSTNRGVEIMTAAIGKPPKLVNGPVSVFEATDQLALKTGADNINYFIVCDTAENISGKCHLLPLL